MQKIMRTLMACGVAVGGLMLASGCRSTSYGGRSCNNGSCGNRIAPTSTPSAAVSNPATPIRTDTGLYAGQKTCPVTDEELGSMGTPIPVTVNGQTIFVCCKGCVAKVQRDPAKYLAKVNAERSGR